MTEQSSEQRERPVLALITESDALPSGVRSGSRVVRHWSPDEADDGRFDGDPGDPATYEWARAAPAVSAVIDLHPADRARAALRALREVRPDAAVLLLTREVADVDGPSDGTVAREGRLRDVIRLDLDEELDRLEAERRAWCLRAFIADADVVPILVHADPDPDALSSALALTALLEGGPERLPIVTLEEPVRPENRRMMELLHMRVTRVTLEELRGFDRVITVDMQPRDLQQDGRPRVAVIDHHPFEQNYSAEFEDVRPEYGATATIVTEYLRATDPRRVHRMLATALLYGIKTDTDSLVRGVTPADVEAYAFLQQHADHQLIRRLERGSYAPETARAFGSALRDADCGGGLCVPWLGERTHDEAHILADLADFCLSIENVTWVCVAAFLDGRLDLTLRHVGSGDGAGGLARRLVDEFEAAKGGGHATMARVMIPREQADVLMEDGSPVAALRDRLEELIAQLDEAAATT